MLARRLTLVLGSALLFAIGLARPPSVAAQPNSNTCSSLVQTAITALGNNCTGLGRNSACYGTFRVDATFADPEVQASFSAPADQAAINTLETIRTFPLNTTTSEWGVAVINAQANIPGVLPGQNAVFLLIGDSEIENAVAPEDAFVPGDPLTLTATTATALNANPDTTAESVAQIPQGTELQTDAISEDGLWLRTAFDGLPGWVSRDAVTAEDDLSSLPVYTPQSRTPMQAFYFRTTLGSDCSAAPDAVVVQGPQNMTIDITANGADIRLGSTVALQTLPADPTTTRQLVGDNENTPPVSGLFQITVLDGEAVIYPDTDQEVRVPEGYTAATCLSEPEDLNDDGAATDSTVVEGCGFTEPQPMSEEQQRQFSSLDGVNLNYPIDVQPSEATEEAPISTPVTSATPVTGACQPRTDWAFTYQVRPGDSLSMIAGHYGVSTSEMASGNCIANPNVIYSGQQLRVPSSEPPPLPTVIPPTAVPPTEPPPQPTSVPATSVPATQVPPTSAPTLTPTNTPIPMDLAINAIVSDPNPYPFDMVEFFITVTNLNDFDVYNVVVADLYPDELWEYVSVEAYGYDVESDVWTIEVLEPQEEAGILLTIYLPYESAGQTYTNTPHLVSSEPVDTNTANNSTTITITVQDGTPEASLKRAMFGRIVR